MSLLQNGGHISVYDHKRFRCPLWISSSNRENTIATTETNESFYLTPDEKGKYRNTSDPNCWAISRPLLVTQFLHPDEVPDDGALVDSIREKLEYYQAIFESITESELAQITQIARSDTRLGVSIYLQVDGSQTIFDKFECDVPAPEQEYYHNILKQRMEYITTNFSVKKQPKKGVMKILPVRER